MPSVPEASGSAEAFSCHACGGHDFRVIVEGQFALHEDHGSGARSDAYACTNRGHGRFSRVVACTACDLRTLHPMPSMSEIHAAYDNVEDREYLSIEPPRRVAFSRILERVHARRKPPGRLLDVGCYTGLFPLIAAERGWDAWGVEPSRWASDIASTRLPGHIHHGMLDTAPFAPVSFDVITSWDVIEHVTDPKGEIERMARLLKPGGWLFLSTMHSTAPIVRLLGARWPWYMAMHLFYFTPQTLGRLLEQAGFACDPPERYPHYTSVQYVTWKLESSLGPVARAAGSLARGLRLQDQMIKVDLGDFFLLAAHKRPNE